MFNFIKNPVLRHPEEQETFQRISPKTFIDKTFISFFWNHKLRHYNYETTYFYIYKC